MRRNNWRERPKGTKTVFLTPKKNDDQHCPFYIGVAFSKSGFSPRRYSSESSHSTPCRKNREVPQHNDWLDRMQWLQLQNTWGRWFQKNNGRSRTGRETRWSIFKIKITQDYDLLAFMHNSGSMPSWLTFVPLRDRRVTRYNVLYVEAPPEKIPFLRFRPLYMKRLENLNCKSNVKMNWILL